MVGKLMSAAATISFLVLLPAAFARAVQFSDL